MTVREFIVWLQTQDQEATVQVIQHTSGSGYYDQGGNATIVNFDPSNTGLFDYTDMRGNEFITPDKPYFNKRTLCIGQYEG